MKSNKAHKTQMIAMATTQTHSTIWCQTKTTIRSKKNATQALLVAIPMMPEKSAGVCK